MSDTQDILREQCDELVAISTRVYELDSYAINEIETRIEELSNSIDAVVDELNYVIDSAS